MFSMANAAERKPSRLSHITRKLLVPPKAGHTQDSDAVSIQSGHSGHSLTSDWSGFKDNYRITKIASRRSYGLGVSAQTQYRVTLELSPKEIALLRYTWNKMLVEEAPVIEDPLTRSALPLPGSIYAQAKEKPAAPILTRQALGALSTFCAQLYDNLLTMAPDLELAFPLLRHQAVLMAGVLSVAVNSLENLSCLDDYLTEMGKRHSRILGIVPAQFELMGEALVQTFRERFGTRFTHELEILWIKFFMYLSNLLLQFGMDPVLTCETDELTISETLDSDDAYLMSNLVRQDKATVASSVVLTRAAPSLISVPVQKPPTPTTAAKKEKKKRSRIPTKKGDCTIM